MTDLGTLGGGDSRAYGVNNAGTIVGASYLPGYSSASDPTYIGLDAFSFSHGVMSDLGTLGGAGSIAYGINDAGTIVGQSYTAEIDLHAFIYKNGAMNDLGTLPGDSSSIALAVNNSDTVVGLSFSSVTHLTHAFVYSNGVMSNLAGFGGNSTEPNSINDSGVVVGLSFLTGNTGADAFAYHDGITSDFKKDGAGYSINNGGVIVGEMELRSGNPPFHAFSYWNGATTDLDTAAHVDGVTLWRASDLNESGQIIAQGNDGLAYLLTPNPGAVPEPATYGMMGAAVLLTAIAARRRVGSARAAHPGRKSG